MKLIFNLALLNILYFNEAEGGGAGGDSSASAAIATTDSGSATPSEATLSNTGGDAALSSPDTSGQSALPSVDFDQIIASIPEGDDDLNEQTVNHREALVTARGQLRALAPVVKDLRPLEPFKALVQRGTPEMLTSRLDQYDQLFTPVTDPQTQLALRDERTGAPLYSTTPFWESMRAKQVGFIEQATHDLMYLPVKDQNGEAVMIPGRNEPETVLRQVLRSIQLNPDRWSDYKNIDTLLAQSGNAITAEDLKGLPEELHDAYKAYPASLRSQLWGMDEEGRNFILQREKERLDAAKLKAEQEKTAEENQTRETQRIREAVAVEQNKFIAQERQDGWNAIMNSLEQQVTFSGDEKTNQVHLALIGTFITSLLEKEFDFAVQRGLKAIGKEPNGFHDALDAATTHSLNYKLYELGGQGALAEQEQGLAYGPKQQVITKAGQIALDLAMALGAQRKAKSDERNQLLAQAGAGRVIPDGTTVERGQSPLPAGMRADSAEANALIWANIQRQNAQA